MLPSSPTPTYLHKIVANPEIFGHDVDGIAGEDGGMEDMTLLDST